MSEEQASEGADWVRQAIARLAQELGLKLRRGYTFFSPEDAGGRYFDRELWVLTALGKSGQPVRVEFPQDDLEDLHDSRNKRDRIEERLRVWLRQVGTAGRGALEAQQPDSGQERPNEASVPPQRRSVQYFGYRGVVGKFDDYPSSPYAAPPFQGTQTIVFTDLAEHTPMMQRLGDDRGHEVLSAYDSITRELLVRHGGREVKALGDGFLVAFASAKSALEWACALQDATRDLARRCGEPLKVRIGMNAGEPIVDRSDDLIGNAVIVARRIVELAQGGDVLVSDVVRQLVAGKGFSFDDLGNCTLKGIDGTTRLWKLRRR